MSQRKRLERLMSHSSSGAKVPKRRMDDTDLMLLHLLSTSSSGLTDKEHVDLAREKYGISRATVYRRRHRLEREGRVIHDGERYRLNPTAEFRPTSSHVFRVRTSQPWEDSIFTSGVQEWHALRTMLGRRSLHVKRRLAQKRWSRVWEPIPKGWKPRDWPSQASWPPHGWLRDIVERSMHDHLETVLRILDLTVHADRLNTVRDIADLHLESERLDCARLINLVYHSRKNVRLAELDNLQLGGYTVRYHAAKHIRPLPEEWFMSDEDHRYLERMTARVDMILIGLRSSSFQRDLELTR
jgi:hypothetical protein